MFGDTLCRAQCAELVDRLKKTKACFSCAHGRPTMVPLVNMRLTREATMGQGVQKGIWGLPAKDTSLEALREKLQQH